jgi:threonyl-tRNA synthetase
MDHRELGQQLKLFMFSPLSPGNPIWLPNGLALLNVLQDKIRRFQQKNGYIEVRTPVLWKPELYQTSGHWDHYRQNMFTIEGERPDMSTDDTALALKPMNCPGHMMIYKSGQYSYNELPLRMADMGVLHRNETSGAIGGLTRCRSFCQDDAHIFCAPEQVESEITKLVGMVLRVYAIFGMPVRAVVATRPKKFMGDPQVWDKAEWELKKGVGPASCTVDEGGGAFYGPKIDFYVQDSQGREWQTATIQLDFQLPERFELEYIDKDNTRKRPVVIHRAIFGSFERFVGVLIEHYQGKFPCWLAPIQAILLPIADRHLARRSSRSISTAVACVLSWTRATTRSTRRSSWPSSSASP